MENCYNRESYEKLKKDDAKRNTFRNFYIPELVRLFTIHSAIDIGGGTGVFTAELLRAGVKDAVCVDRYDGEELLEIEENQFISFDLNKVIFNKKELQNKVGTKKYDLVSCLEVAEHLEADSASSLIEILTGFGDVVLFSAAIPYQLGDGHINEQWPSYWEELFAQKGYRRVDWFRKKFWDEYDCIGYYRQNILLYIKEEVLPQYPQLLEFADNEALQLPRHLVHPTVYNYAVRNSLNNFTIEKYPRLELEQMHVQNTRALLDRVEMLKHIPKGGVFVEVGVANGDFSKQIYEICKPSKLYCIDIWWDEETYRKSNENLKEGIENGTIELLKGDSREQLLRLEENSIDFVYIDAMHDYAHPRDELAICRQLVKPEGYIAGHDYVVINVFEKPALQYGVVNAVNEFVVKNDYEFIYITLEALYDTPSYCLRRR